MQYYWTLHGVKVLQLNLVCCLGQFEIDFRQHSGSSPGLLWLSSLHVASGYDRYSTVAYASQFWGQLDRCRGLHKNMFYFIPHFHGFIAAGCSTAWIWANKRWIPRFSTYANSLVTSES